MKKLIVCPKQSGNTYKVCSYISSHSDIELKVIDNVTKYDLPYYDVIILSSGVYGGQMHKNISKWLKRIKKDVVSSNTKFYIFLTWFGRGNSDKVVFGKVKDLLNEKDIKLQDDYMKCFGKGFGIIRTTHPNEEECKRVLLWANKL